MNILLDKSVLVIFSAIGLCLFHSGFVPIIVFLVMLSASALIQLFSGNKASAALIAAVSASCFFVPKMLFAMPVILYDALREKKLKFTLPAALVLLNSSLPSFPQILLILTGTLTAFIIFYRTSSLEKMLENLKMQRDSDNEQNIYLAEQNSKLIEAQDDAVRLATLKERNRIAREIHDNVGHMLTRSLLQSGALIIINKDEKMKEPLETLKSTLDTAMTNIRESVHDLHDDSIDLKMVINDSISSVSENFSVNLDYDASDNISGNIKLCVAGIIKESISNAVKHSNGDRISIVFREHPSFFQLMVEDNGSSAKITESGIGLKNMENRAKGAGGNISFSATEKGFKIFASIPKG